MTTYAIEPLVGYGPFKFGMTSSEIKNIPTFTPLVDIDQIEGTDSFEKFETYTDLEPVSKPLKYSEQTSELHEAVIQMRVIFVTYHQSAKAFQPADRAFDFPAFPVAA